MRTRTGELYRSVCARVRQSQVLCYGIAHEVLPQQQYDGDPLKVLRPTVICVAEKVEEQYMSVDTVVDQLHVYEWHDEG